MSTTKYVCSACKQIYTPGPDGFVVPTCSCKAAIHASISAQNLHGHGGLRGTPRQYSVVKNKLSLAAMIGIARRILRHGIR